MTVNKRCKRMQSRGTHFNSSCLCYSNSRHFLLSTSFLTASHRLLQFSSPPESAAEETSEAPSSPTSPRGISSLSSSNLPSPVLTCNRPKSQTWSLDTDLSSSRAPTLTSVPSPSALQDNSSQNAQSSRKIVTVLCGNKNLMKLGLLYFS